MSDLQVRIQNAKKEITGNEALLDMLDAEAGTEMLNWGISMAASIADRTAALDDAAAEEALSSELKAVRGVMRSMGNWAAGKYADPASRAPLKEKLLEQLKLILGEGNTIPSSTDMDALLNLVDGAKHSPGQLIEKFKETIESSRQGG